MLGVEQMTTDTAINVSKMILQDEKHLDSFSFINQPEIPTGDGVNPVGKEVETKGVFDCGLKDQEGEFACLNFKFIIDEKGAPFTYQGKKVLNYPLISPGIHKILSSDF